MKYRTLPGTDLDVSEVCLGTMTWGEQNSEADAHAQLDCALAHGVNFIDTAEMYPVPPNAATQGRTEAFLGSWLARRKSDRVVVATKVAGPGRREWIRGGRTDLTRDVIAEAVETSLARLKIDCIDLYQIHWPQRNVPMFGATEFDPTKERQGPSIDEQVGRTRRADQGRQDPPLRIVQRDGLGRVRIPPRRERARRPGAGDDPEQLQPRSRAASTTISPKRCFARTCRSSPTARSPAVSCRASIWAERNPPIRALRSSTVSACGFARRSPTRPPRPTRRLRSGWESRSCSSPSATCEAGGISAR